MREKIGICLLAFLLLSGCSQRKNPVVEGDILWDRANEMDRYLSHSVWTYNEGEEILFMQFGANARIVKIVGAAGDENFGDCSKLQRYYVDHHEKNNEDLNYIPYLVIGDKEYDFLEIKEDSFILADFNNGEPCLFTRKEIGQVKIKGKYRYDGKIYFFNFIDSKGSIFNRETGMKVQFTEIDEKRIQISESIFSDIPIYRWWEDEEGNLYLLSEGMEVSGLSNEEILRDYPVIVLEKVIE